MNAFLAPHPGVYELPALSTARLTLRMVEDTDADDFQRICSDAEIASWAGAIPIPYPEGEAAGWIASQREQLARGEGSSFAIVETSSGRVVGDVSLRVEPVDHRAEIGFILDRAHWGNGYATEAVAAVVRSAFEDMGLNRLYAYVYVTNAASIRVFEKLGFVREARLRENAMHNGAFEDDWLYAMIRADWEALP